MRRLIGSIAVIAAALVLLTSCSPPRLGTLGILRNEDGTLNVLVRLCEGSLYKVGLDPVGPATAANDDRQTTVSVRQPDTMWVELSSPVIGNSEIAFPFVESELREDIRYQLWGVVGAENAETQRQAGNAFSTVFEASELAALPRGMVLSPSDNPGVALLPRDFEEFAVKFCS
jgi:hypothetical protein